MSSQELGDSFRQTITVGSRKSKLALIQTEIVIGDLKKYHPNLKFIIKTLDTMGDNILDRPLAKIGEKALFTKELEDELLNGDVDLIVHSLKDLPTTLPDKCCIGAITKRENPSDSLVLRGDLHLEPSNLSLDSMISSTSMTFGTSSLRRIAQLKSIARNVSVKDVRGNLNTRLAKLDNHQAFGYDCLILATAGLIRGGFRDRISLQLDWYHAVSQGALGIECRSDDHYIIEHLLAPLIDQRSALECTAERVLMKCLEGGCSVPIGVRNHWHNTQSSWELTLEAKVLTTDGLKWVKSSITKDLDQPIIEINEQGDKVKWKLHDYTDILMTNGTVDLNFNLRIKNAVLLGRELASKMFELNVKEILKQINENR